jgi:hypothetical protein
MTGRLRHALPLLLVLAGLGAGTSAASSSRPSDRSIKLDLVAKLRQSPQILILGDSRGRYAEPSYVQRLTGHTGFNAAVMGGSTPDFWVFTRYAADRFPRQRRRYIWFVSSGLMTNIVDPRTKGDARGRRYLAEVAPYLSSQVDNAPWAPHPYSAYRRDGSLPPKAARPSAAHVQQVKAQAEALVAGIREHPPVAPRFDAKHYQLFEHLLAYLNARGERPVIVFNPLYPTVYAELKKYGLPLSTSSLDYLRRLRRRYRFVVVDCEDAHRWGGTDSDWDNPTHVNRFNMRRMLRYVVAHSGGALR